MTARVYARLEKRSCSRTGSGLSSRGSVAECTAVRPRPGARDLRFRRRADQWLDDPDTRSLEAFELKPGRSMLVTALRDDQRVQLEPLYAMSLSLSDLLPGTSLGSACPASPRSDLRGRAGATRRDRHLVSPRDGNGVTRRLAMHTEPLAVRDARCPVLSRASARGCNTLC